MGTVALAVGFVLLIVAHAAITGFLVVRPARAIQVLFRLGFTKRPWLAAVMRIPAMLPPWFWLWEGRSVEEVLEVARSNPEEFPRMVAAIRLLGAFALSVNVGIVLLILLMIAFA